MKTSTLARLLATIGAVAIWSTLVVPVQRWSNGGYDHLGTYLTDPVMAAVFAAVILGVVATMLPQRWPAMFTVLAGVMMAALGLLLPERHLLWDGYDPVTHLPTGGTETTQPWLGQRLWLMGGLLQVAAGVLILASRRVPTPPDAPRMSGGGYAEWNEAGRSHAGSAGGAGEPRQPAGGQPA